MNICCVTCAFLSQTKFKPSASVFLTRTVVLLRLSCDMAMCAESQSGAQAAIVKEKFFVFPVMHTSAGIQREYLWMRVIVLQPRESCVGVVATFMRCAGCFCLGRYVK